MLKAVRSCFNQIKDPTANHKNCKITLTDCLLSGMAVFGLKYSSLLQLDNDRGDEDIVGNLKSLYGISNVPSDTTMRERLDEVSPTVLRSAFKKLFSLLQRSKVLEQYTYLDDHYLLAVDGTGFFSSSSVHCENCCAKHHRDGRVTYYHQMLCAVLVHPERKEVFPIAPEAILKPDGHTKNDCESNAAKRLLADFRREHPHLKCIVVEDSLSSNEPHIKLLEDLNLRFILGAKASNHQFLFNKVESSQQTKIVEITGKNNTLHCFRHLNRVPLNASHPDRLVNFIEYWEKQPNKKKVLHFSWVTDIEIQEDNLMQIMRAGRARWRIENETFNTLKNQGYHFEHNFGHGYKHLSTVFAFLMLLSFLIDQIQQHCCPLFQAARHKLKSNFNLWEKIRSLFFNHIIPDWETIYKALIFRFKRTLPDIYDSS